MQADIRVQRARVCASASTGKKSSTPMPVSSQQGAVVCGKSTPTRMFERLKTARKAGTMCEAPACCWFWSRTMECKNPPMMPTADVRALITAGGTLEGDESLEQRQ